MKEYYYTLYGIDVKSEIALPLEEKKEHRSAAIEICYGQVEIEERPPQGHTAVRKADTIYFVWPDGSKAKVWQGKEILVEPTPNVDEKLLGDLLITQAVAIALHQRDFLLFHASAVAIEGYVVAFLADSGVGKSTTAAAFVQAGYPLITDDLLVVDWPAGQAPHIRPAPPRIKLWEQSRRGLGLGEDATVALAPTHPKRLWHMGNAAESALPLQRLYLLQRGDKVEVPSISKAQLLAELLQHSYCGGLLEGAEHIRHFQQTASLIQQVSLQRLVFPARFDALEEIVARITKIKEVNM